MTKKSSRGSRPPTTATARPNPTAAGFDAGLSQMGKRTGHPAISWLMDKTLGNPGLISLAAGFTDNASLPVDQTRQSADEVLQAGASGQVALQYGSTSGDPELRRLTADLLRHSDHSPAKSVTYNPDHLLITHGSQQLLYLIVEALCDPGDIVLVEDPTYFVFLGILQSHGIRCRAIRMREDGLDTAHLDEVLSQIQADGELHRVKLLYAVTYFQNPSGITTSLKSKGATLELLARHEKSAGHTIYYLEDAAYRDLRFEGEDVPSMLTLEASPNRVIYAGTYSKPYATGLRVGFGVLPEPLLTAVTRIKGNHDFGTSHFPQKLIVQAIRSGRYARQLKTLQERYRRKAREMTEAIRNHFPPQVEWANPSGGLYVWAKLPPKISTGPESSLFEDALKHNVLYVPGSLCHASDPAREIPDNAMRISFGGARETEIGEGVRRLGQAIARRLKAGKAGRQKS